MAVSIQRASNPIYNQKYDYPEDRRVLLILEINLTVNPKPLTLRQIYGISYTDPHPAQPFRDQEVKPRSLSHVGPQSLIPKPYLDPGCPTFFGVYPTNLWDITPKKEGHPGSR